MHTRKYTREQLEFYFKKLMDKLKRIPREEDIDNAQGYPSSKMYVERFGSWQNAVNMFANFDLARKKCKACGKEYIQSKKSQKYCSDECSKINYQKKFSNYNKNTDKKIKEILGDRCVICDFDSIVEVHCLDNKKESIHKILTAYNKKNMHDYVLLCPNHHQMIHNKLAKLDYDKDELVWKEA